MNTLRTPKVSILVPIFRVEKYLRQCVDSLIQQTLKDIEIILIDDGSDDSCPQICDEYAANDPRVKVIHKANSGYGASMNQGLKLASGDYIGIVESDDWVEPNTFEELYELATQHDVNVVRSNFFEYSDKDGDKFAPVLPESDTNQVIDPRDKTGIFYCQPAIWASLYRRSFLMEKNIDFLESPGASYQDVAFNFKIWAMAERVWLTDKAYYHYRCDNAGSSVKAQDKIFCVVDEWKEVERYLDQYPEEKEASFVLRNHIKLGNYNWNLRRLGGDARKMFHKVFSREYRDILNNDGICREYLSKKEWDELITIAYPGSTARALRFLRTKISRMFVKDKVRDGKKKYSVLFGLVRYERDIRLPEWKGGNSPQ